MLGEIITTFAGASLVIGVALAGGTVHRTTPSPSAQWSQEAWGVAKLKRTGMIPGAGGEDGRAAPGELPSPIDPRNGAAPPEPPDGLVAGLIISADMFVGNTDSDRHTLTVRPADSRREFKARVVGMGDEGSGTPAEQTLIAPDTALATALAPLAVPHGVGPPGIDGRPAAKIRA
ncbi:hypothetical protein [Aromatoleum anaerobium]|uniref:Type II secretion system protein GspC N-terminal domain-containing protein n=1 Tax=Aromatoleum anaerobium TaxID=182180 RepID=A0ABX1PK65_9RHOO|nr:hypothetical protein [Aromatoleum anaerobium]MCK0508363.1 hypothetical protein [Aromatoleum anaerobium]